MKGVEAEGLRIDFTEDCDHGRQHKYAVRDHHKGEECKHRDHEQIGVVNMKDHSAAENEQNSARPLGWSALRVVRAASSKALPCRTV